ncbi:MAG: hypothetical protein JJE47_17390 [Acidimicrobiia bacterium]|nr:hypothetical protein [Acidimicrobiia bacterium]
MSLARLKDERGATAILVATMMIFLLGMAALAIDVGFGFNERRQDQTAADAGALAAAVEAKVLGNTNGVVTEALDYVRANLDTTYTNAEWEAMWLACTDPEKSVAPLAAYNFIPVSTPTSWTSSGTLDCMSISSAGYFRVNVPDQIVETTFGKVLGVSQLTTSADAISRLAGVGTGGILPFGLPASIGEGNHSCLSSGPKGNAEPPCDGAANGNFGVLKARLFGNTTMGTPQNCTASPLGQVLAVNIAAGLDHWVTLDGDGLNSNEVRDVCANEGQGVDTLNTDTGFPGNGAEEGLATGPVNYGFAPRLQQGPPGDRASRFGYQLNDKPLWAYLVGGLQSITPGPTFVPAACLGFDNVTESDFDWDSDGTLDRPESWQHMATCLTNYVAGSYSAVMFTETLETNPRFAYVPQFYEDALGNGSSWLHIKRFKAIFIQGTWWKKSGATLAFHPGEICAGCSANGYSMLQLSGFIMPDNALPTSLRADPPPGGGFGPYDDVELWR